MDEVKRAVVEWWLRTILLPFLGRRFPDFLQAVCQDLGFSERDKRLIYLRYTLKKGWKEKPKWNLDELGKMADIQKDLTKAFKCLVKVDVMMTEHSIEQF